MDFQLLIQLIQDCRWIISAVQVRPLASDINPRETGLDDRIDRLRKLVIHEYGGSGRDIHKLVAGLCTGCSRSMSLRKIKARSSRRLST